MMSASKTSEGASAAQDIEKYDIPEPEPFVSFQALKDRIRHHYEVASDYYYSLWYVYTYSLPEHVTSRTDLNIRGEHIHHGYWITPDDTKEKAQVQLIELLLQRSEFKAGSKVLDVGCGIGGVRTFSLPIFPPPTHPPIDFQVIKVRVLTHQRLLASWLRITVVLLRA